MHERRVVKEIVLKPGWLRSLRDRLSRGKYFARELSCLALACVRATYLVLMTGRTRDRYGIKACYLPRSRYVHCDASESSGVHQDLIYRGIRDFFVENDLHSLLDIGCGNGLKLLKYFDAYSTLGLEKPPALYFLEEEYPRRDWRLSDFDAIPSETFDMVISVDVIEHLLDPDELMTFISKVDCTYVALSTPNRSRLSRQSRIGPPRNVHHIREWNREEFVEYVSRFCEVLESVTPMTHEHYVICRK